MQGHRIRDIALQLSATFAGDADLIIERVNEPAMAGPSDLAVAMDPKFTQDIASGRAKAAILQNGTDWQALGLSAAIFVERPRLALAGLTRMLKIRSTAKGIHASAIIDPTAVIGTGCYIGPYAVIGANVHIGNDSHIGAQSCIGDRAKIGDNSRLSPGVQISDDVQIGARFFAHSGVVIGADGYSFVTGEKSNAELARESLGKAAAKNVDQIWQKIESLGGVTIGDDVEIGANSNIDAGTIRPTSVADGTKIDALVQVGHNVVIGRNCLLCAQVGVAGSTRIGNNVVLGGQVGVGDNLQVGDGVVAAGGSLILSNVPAGRSMAGSPAVTLDQHVQIYKALRRLPRTARDVAALKKPVSNSDASD